MVQSENVSSPELPVPSVHVSATFRRRRKKKLGDGSYDDGIGSVSHNDLASQISNIMSQSQVFAELGDPAPSGTAEIKRLKRSSREFSAISREESWMQPKQWTANLQDKKSLSKQRQAKQQEAVEHLATYLKTMLDQVHKKHADEMATLEERHRAELDNAVSRARLAEAKYAALEAKNSRDMREMAMKLERAASSFFNERLAERADKTVTLTNVDGSLLTSHRSTVSEAPVAGGGVSPSPVNGAVGANGGRRMSLQLAFVANNAGNGDLASSSVLMSSSRQGFRRTKSARSQSVDITGYTDEESGEAVQTERLGRRAPRPVRRASVSCAPVSYAAGIGRFGYNSSNSHPLPANANSPTHSAPGDCNTDRSQPTDRSQQATDRSQQATDRSSVSEEEGRHLRVAGRTERSCSEPPPRLELSPSEASDGPENESARELPQDSARLSPHEAETPAPRSPQPKSPFRTPRKKAVSFNLGDYQGKLTPPVQASADPQPRTHARAMHRAASDPEGNHHSPLHAHTEEPITDHNDNNNDNNNDNHHTDSIDSSVPPHSLPADPQGPAHDSPNRSVASTATTSSISSADHNNNNSSNSNSNGGLSAVGLDEPAPWMGGGGGSGIGGGGGMGGDGDGGVRRRRPELQKGSSRSVGALPSALPQPKAGGIRRPSAPAVSASPQRRNSGIPSPNARRSARLPPS